MGGLGAHRLLLLVYGFAFALAALELSNPQIRPGRPDEPAVYLEPGTNVADVSAALYPERALSLYYRAYQASLCDEVGAEASSVCRERGPVEPGEIRDLLERSLATGNRSIELAMYNYAMVLLQENARAADVDAAIRSWRRAHPGSSRPDPRIAYREMRRSQTRAPR